MKIKRVRSKKSVSITYTADEIDMLDNIIAFYKHENMPHDPDAIKIVQDLSRGTFQAFKRTCL